MLDSSKDLEAFKDFNAFRSSIVRLSTVQGGVVGTGFLVGRKYVVTCAHVINDALERDQDTPEQPVNEKIYLNFPHASPKKSYTAHVVCWHPPRSLDASTRDVGILELEETAPHSVTETQFVSSPVAGGSAEHQFHTYGFPGGYDDKNGGFARGILQAPSLDDYWLQLAVLTNPGVPIQPGFSGAPVWDQHDNGVVGMIADVVPNDGVAFAIPTEKLIKAWPPLEEYVNNNLASIAKELQDYLKRLSDHLAVLPAYYPSDFTFDQIRQRVRMSQQYDPAYEGGSEETIQAYNATEEKNDSSALSVQAYKASPGRNIWSYETIRAFGAEVASAEDANRPVTESIVVDWETLRNMAERVVILGDPGSGKSWLLKYEGRAVAGGQLDKLEHGLLRPNGVLFPIFLRLGTLAGEIIGGSRDACEVIVQLLKRQYLPSASERFLNYIRRWLAGTQCLLLLDALDEVAEDRRKKIKDVLRQISEDSGCRILLTSRFVGYTGVPFVHKGGKWKRELEIVAFAQEQIEGFIHSWFGDYKDGAQRLLNALHSETSLRSFAGSPLLLSFLCLATAESRTIPTQRAALYERVLRLLLQASWRKDANDISEELFDTRIEAKLVLLESLAWHFATLNGRWHDLMATQELEDLVRKRSQGEDLVKIFPSYEQLITELTEKDALLIKVNSSQRIRQQGKIPYLFLHRTIHEYLVARYLAALPIDRCLELIRSHFLFDSSREVIIQLLTGCLVDPNLLLDALLREPYDAFYTMLFLASSCLVEAELLVIKEEIRAKIINELFDLLLLSSKHNQSMAIRVMGMIGEPILDKVLPLLQSKRSGTPLYPPSIREAAIRILGQINHPRVLPQLLTIFTTQDDRAKQKSAIELWRETTYAQKSDIELWSETASALGHMNDPQAVQALIDALSSGQSRFIISAARGAIRQMDYSHSVSIIHKALKKEKNSLNRNALIRALTNIGNEEAVTALLDVLRSNYRAYEALLSLRQSVASLLSIPDNTEHRNSWLEALKTGEPMVTLALGHKDDVAVKDLLVAVQGISNSEVDIARQWDEAWNVTQPDEALTSDSSRRQNLQDSDTWILMELWNTLARARMDERLAISSALQLVASLKEIGNQRSVEALRYLLNCEYQQPWNNEFRKRLIRAVGATGDPQAITDLLQKFHECVQALENAQGDEKRITDTKILLGDVIEALGESGSAQVVQVFIASLKEGLISGFDNNYLIRGLIVDALGELGDNQAVDLLLTMLYDEDQSILYKVAQALGKLDSVRAVDLLLSNLHISFWRKILSYSAEFLRQEEATGKPPLVAAFLKYREFRETTAYALKCMGEIEKLQIVRALLKARNTSNRYMRDIATNTIGRLVRQQDVTIAVETLLNKTEDLDTRKKAAILLARIGDERVVDKLLLCLQEASLVPTIKTALDIISTNCDIRVFYKKLVWADAELGLDRDTRIFIYDLLAQHFSQLREAVGKSGPAWRKKLFPPTAYVHSVVKSQNRIWQWNIRMQKVITSWNSYKGQLYSDYELYKKDKSTTRSQNQPSPEYKASLSEIFMTILGIKENTAAWLSYIGGWLTGILFFLLWRRNPSVRLQAIQSIVIFGSINILQVACSSFSNLSIANPILYLTAFICWVAFMRLARRNKDFKLPVIGNWISKFGIQIGILSILALGIFFVWRPLFLLIFWSLGIIVVGFCLTMIGTFFIVLVLMYLYLPAFKLMRKPWRREKKA